MSTRFRLYIHSAGPAFRSRTKQEVNILMKSCSPGSKAPQIKETGSTGLVVRGTLRDLYVLAHGLKTADDILVQLIKPTPRVGSLNKLIQSLQTVPIHAFAPRVVPFRSTKVHGRLTDAELREEELLRKDAESHLLHNNIRVLSDKSILCNRDLVRKFASETFREKLLLRRGQALKRRNVQYTDNPVLFGKSIAEGEEILRLIAESGDHVDAIGESALNEDDRNEQLLDLDDMDVDPEQFNNSSVLFDDIVDEHGEVDTLKLRSVLAKMKKQQRGSMSGMDDDMNMSDDEVELDDDAVKMIKTHVKDVRQGKDVETLTMEFQPQSQYQDDVDVDSDNEHESKQFVVRDSMSGSGGYSKSNNKNGSISSTTSSSSSSSSSSSTTTTTTSQSPSSHIAISDDSTLMADAETALQQIANNEVVPAAMGASLQVTAMLHMGATTSTSSTKIISKAVDSIPTIQSFLPPELAKLSEKKIRRRAKSDPEVRRMVERADIKVDEMTIRLKQKDKKVNKLVRAHKEAAPVPAMYIPHRPSDDVSANAMTLQLDHNRLTLSLSAVGQQHQALFKRGWRTHIIETSMRETIAAGCISIAYERMSPLDRTSPLTRLEDKDMTEPIRETFLDLASRTKIGRGSQETLTATERKAQAHMLASMERHMGSEEAQAALLGALVDEHNDLLSRKDILDSVRKGTAGDITIAGVGIQQLQDSVTANGASVTGINVGTSSDVTSSTSVTGHGSSKTVDNNLTNTSSIINPTQDISLNGVVKPTGASIIDAISKLPIHHQAQAAASLAAGIPFDPIAPIPSPTLVPLSKHGSHARDSTQLSELLAYTMSAAITDSDPAVRIFDPFCGSGTLVIESVFRFMGLPTPPLPRPFAFENWPIHNEYEYNALMREWNNKYDETVQRYVDKFGVSKANSLFGEGYENEDMNLDNFPLFVGSDLRDKSVRAAVHNAKSARVNYFTQFYKSDFERIMNQAGSKWEEYVRAQTKQPVEPVITGHGGHATKPGSFSAKAASMSSSSSTIVGADGLIVESHPALIDAQLIGGDSSLGNDERSDIYDGPMIPSGILSPNDIMNMMNFEPKQPHNDRAIARREREREHARALQHTPFTQANELPLRFPYLKGYTMFSNIPWGVSDQKSHMTGSQRYNREDKYARGHVNTTQNEPVEDLYQRLGAALYRHGHLFRDVFILSAHVKFQKLTAIGAQRAYHADEKRHNKTSNAVMISNNVARITNPGDLQWEVVTSFYNQGVRTDLLKLKRE